MDEAAVDKTALPEGACITTEIPNTAVTLLAAIMNNTYHLAPLTAVIRDGGQTISDARVRVVGKSETGVEHRLSSLEQRVMDTWRHPCIRLVSGIQQQS